MLKQMLDTGSGHVTHDDRGNAVWSWDSHSEYAVSAVDLAVVADAGENRPMVAHSSTYAGFNPYQSGLVQKEARAPRRDLRELSRWIEQRNKLAAR
jgi:hypothetical protein